MEISQKGLNLIKDFEGCVLHSYYDAVGVLTIGYGTTNADASIIGTRIYDGMTISQETAEDWLRKSVNNKYVPLVMKWDSTYHWNQNQLDALTSFAYNIGSIDQLTGYGSRSISEISNKILAYNRAGGNVLAGLTRRRIAEKTLFDSQEEVDNNWVLGDKGWRYKQGNDVVRNKWMTIGNKEYYFKANGYMASNEYIKSSSYKVNGYLYYVGRDGVWDGKIYKWFKDNAGYWLAEENGAWYARNSWARVDFKWYYFNSKGYMVHGKDYVIDGVKYHFNNDGSLAE